VPPSLVAPLLFDELPELPLPCENPLELPVDELPLPESVAVAAPVDAEDEELESLLESLPEWVSVPGPEPLRPGTVCTVELAVAPEEADEAEAPSVMFVPVARKEERIVLSFPSTTVLFVPAALL
jgi:hypothetical protein